MFLIIFMSFTWMVESTELQLLETKEPAPYQVILLANDKINEQGKLVWDFAATGVILNEQWVLTTMGFNRLRDYYAKNLTKTTVIAGDTNFLENVEDTSSRYRQTLLACDIKVVKKFMLLKVNGKFHIDGKNIQRVQLPKTYVSGAHTLENGFPSKSDKCQVWGWKKGSMEPIGEVQNVGKVKITELEFMNSNQYIGVKRSLTTMKKIMKSFQNNRCHAGECTEMKIVGMPLMCRRQDDKPWILMGVGDWDPNWQWMDTNHAFVRVSTYIYELRQQMQASTPDLYLYQGVEGQPSKFAFQAIVKVTHQGSEQKYVHQCQGAIVSHNKVLTAASCFDNNLQGQSVTQVTVVVGVTDLRIGGTEIIARSWWQYDETDLEGGSRPQQQEKYDQYDDFDFYNIGIIELSKDLTFDDNVKTVNLARTTESLDGCTVSSWEKKGQSYYPMIRYRHVSVLESKRCNSPMLKPNVLEKFFDEHLCVKEREEGQYPSIEEGAPMTCYVNGRVYLVGIASFAANFGELSLERFGGEQGPKIFTSIPAHVRWIDAKVQA